jgi:hypothetical protein
MSIYIDIHTGLKKHGLKNASIHFTTIFSVLKRRNKDIKNKGMEERALYRFSSV